MTNGCFEGLGTLTFPPTPAPAPEGGPGAPVVVFLRPGVASASVQHQEAVAVREVIAGDALPDAGLAAHAGPVLRQGVRSDEEHPPDTDEVLRDAARGALRAPAEAVLAPLGGDGLGGPGGGARGPLGGRPAGGHRHRREGHGRAGNALVVGRARHTAGVQHDELGARGEVDADDAVHGARPPADTGPVLGQRGRAQEQQRPGLHEVALRGGGAREAAGAPAEAVLPAWRAHGAGQLEAEVRGGGRPIRAGLAERGEVRHRLRPDLGVHGHGPVRPARHLHARVEDHEVVRRGEVRAIDVGKAARLPGDARPRLADAGSDHGQPPGVDQEVACLGAHGAGRAPAQAVVAAGAAEDEGAPAHAPVAGGGVVELLVELGHRHRLLVPPRADSAEPAGVEDHDVVAVAHALEGAGPTADARPLEEEVVTRADDLRRGHGWASAHKRLCVRDKRNCVPAPGMLFPALQKMSQH